MKFIFYTITTVLGLLILIGKFFVFDIKNTHVTARYSAFVTMLILLYSVSAILLMFGASFSDKIILFFIAISPYIIGLLATHETIGFYTYLQLTTILASLMYGIKFQFIG